MPVASLHNFSILNMEMMHEGGSGRTNFPERREGRIDSRIHEVLSMGSLLNHRSFRFLLTNITALSLEVADRGMQSLSRAHFSRDFQRSKLLGSSMQLSQALSRMRNACMSNTS